MGTMKKFKCEKCGKNRKLQLFKGSFVCYECFRKGTNSMMIGGQTLKFPEPINQSQMIGLYLTSSQREFLSKRTKELGLKISAYIRELIINDMWLQNKGEKQ